MEGVGSFKPQIGLRSADMVGVEGDLQGDGSKPVLSKKSWPELAYALLPPVVALIFAVFARKRLSEFVTVLSPSVNNTAFVYLQQRMVREALQMLQIKARRRGLDNYEMANMALALGLSGNMEDATKMFSIADWLAKSNHLKSVIAYNRATLAVSQGDYPLAKAKLREAVAFGHGPASKYFRLSSYFAEASKTDPEFELIVS